MSTAPSSRYPEVGAGGYSRVDGNVAFYGRVQALLAEMAGPITIVDFGAGRGRRADDPVAFRRQLQDLRGPDRVLIGVDVDDVVLDNPIVDDARLIGPDGHIPVGDGSVDLVVSEWTFEHVDRPAVAAAELARILRPGGWLCAMTPNKHGYIALGGRAVPNRFHVRALRSLQPGKAVVDTFPTRYLMNSRRQLEILLPPETFDLHTWTVDAEPYLYAGGSRLLEMAFSMVHRAPGPLKSVRIVFARRRGEDE